MPIIYLTTNKINNKKYIGVDSKNNDNYFGSGVAIKLALKKYGKNNFEKNIIEENDDIKYIYEREVYWINFYDAVNSKDFYNINTGGKGGFNLTDDQLKKSIDGVIENNKKRKGKSYEEIYGIDKSLIEIEKRKIGSTDIKRTEETKKKLSISHIGQIPWNKGLNKESDDRVKKNGKKQNIIIKFTH